MLSSLTDLDIQVREHVFESAPAGTLFAFDFVDAIDAGPEGAGPLFEQNGAFWLFETSVVDTRRAGPGMQSPRRAWAELSITYFTKGPDNSIPAKKALEEVAAWFGDQTVRGIRFRTFLPVSPARIQGFTAYSGVINCDFEINP